MDQPRSGLTKVLLVSIAIVASGACVAHTVTAIPRRFDYIPARWVDLPEAPFVAEMRGGEALLVARSKQLFSEVTVGCVVAVEGKTNVVADLIMTTMTHGSFGPQWPVKGLLASLNNPKVFDHLGNASRCPADSYFAVTGAGGDETPNRVTWNAQGTKWPQRR
jgi:hypothetical protein